MPLRDHFNAPLSVRRQWQSFHSAWANAIAGYLNDDLLPQRYVALPNVVLGGAFEVDVAAWELGDETIHQGGSAGTTVWAPARPSLVQPLPFARQDLFEVRVVSEETGHPVAAIELISPANKDRAAHRNAFATKCAASLQDGLSLIVVDTVTTRKSSPQVELLNLFLVPSEMIASMPELCAAAYRVAPRGDESVLEGWVERLAVGSALATLPLWLEPDLALPLDLETSYEAACHALRID